MICALLHLCVRVHIEYIAIDPVTASARLQVLTPLPRRYQNAPQSSNRPSQRAQIPPFLNVSSFEHGFCRADWCEIGAEISGIRTYFQVSQPCYADLNIDLARGATRATSTSNDRADEVFAGRNMASYRQILRRLRRVSRERRHLGIRTPQLLWTCMPCTHLEENARVAIENDSLKSSKSADELTDEMDE